MLVIHDSCGHLLSVSVTCWQLLTLADSFWQIMTYFECCRQFLAIYDRFNSCWQLMTIGKIFFQLLKIADRFWQWLTVHESCWLFPAVAGRRWQLMLVLTVHAFTDSWQKLLTFLTVADTTVTSLDDSWPVKDIMYRCYWQPHRTATLMYCSKWRDWQKQIKIFHIKLVTNPLEVGDKWTRR